MADDVIRPDLTNPKVIQLGNGETYTKLDRTKDYVIRLPEGLKRGHTAIDGGRNVHIIGGTLTCLRVNPRNDLRQRALYIRGAVGTVHVEGVHFVNPNLAEFDAIAIAAPDARVQIKNVRVDGIRGFYDTWHADVLQPWGGVAELLVDGLTGRTAYQGIQFSALTGKVGRVLLRRVDIHATGSQIPRKGLKGGNGGILFWADPDFPGAVEFDEVYLKPRNATGPRLVTWPNSKTQGAVLTGKQVTFPTFPSWKGHITIGEPKGGDFVPASSVGQAARD